MQADASLHGIASPSLHDVTVAFAGVSILFSETVMVGVIRGLLKVHLLISSTVQ